MPWESTVNTLTGKRLDAEASEMRVANIEPIILRWKTALRTSQNIYGFYGVKTWTSEKLNGEIDISGEIDHNKITTFFRDQYNVGYAVIPNCTRNIDVLAATLHDNPAWIIEGPESVVATVKGMAAELYPKTIRGDGMVSLGLGLPEVPASSLTQQEVPQEEPVKAQAPKAPAVPAKKVPLKPAGQKLSELVNA